MQVLEIISGESSTSGLLSCNLMEGTSHTTIVDGTIIKRESKGRAPSMIWEHWEEDRDRAGCVNCIYCHEAPQLKHSGKCRRHTSRCEMAPEEVRHACIEEEERSGRNSMGRPVTIGLGNYYFD